MAYRVGDPLSMVRSSTLQDNRHEMPQAGDTPMSSKHIDRAANSAKGAKGATTATATTTVYQPASTCAVTGAWMQTASALGAHGLTLPELALGKNAKRRVLELVAPTEEAVLAMDSVPKLHAVIAVSLSLIDKVEWRTAALAMADDVRELRGVAWQCVSIMRECGGGSGSSNGSSTTKADMPSLQAADLRSISNWCKVATRTGRTHTEVDSVAVWLDYVHETTTDLLGTGQEWKLLNVVSNRIVALRVEAMDSERAGAATKAAALKKVQEGFKHGMEVVKYVKLKGATAAWDTYGIEGVAAVARVRNVIGKLASKTEYAEEIELYKVALEAVNTVKADIDAVDGGLF